MKIKSNFKDYYDFVGQYNSDPIVTYNRVPLLDTTVLEGYLPRISYTFTGRTKWVIAAGRLYLLDDTSGKFKLSTNAEALTQNYWNTYKFKQGDRNATALKWCKELKTPVFELSLGNFRGKARFYSVKKLPVLGELGFPALISAEQMYQDIAYFIGNTINTNPDIACPASTSEKDRIVAHGFDLKTSFRGKA